MRNWLFSEEGDELTLSEKEREYRKIKLKKAEKQKHSGFLNTVIYGPAAISLAIILPNFATFGLQSTLLCLAIGFSITAIAYLLLWKGLDATIATIQKELETNKRIEGKLNYFKCAAFLYLSTIIITALLLRYWWPTVFLAMHTHSMAPVVQSFQSRDKGHIEFAIPKAYQRSLWFLPRHSPHKSTSHTTVIPKPYVYLTAELPDLAPWNPDWASLRALSGSRLREKRGDGHILNSYMLNADSDLIGVLLTPYFTIAKQDKDITHTPVRYGLHSLSRPFTYRTTLKGGSATIFSNISHLQPVDAQNYPEMLFICRDACMIASSYKQELGLLITFDNSQRKDWKEIMEKVNLLLASMEASAEAQNK